ncbi:EpsG family protein [Chryseobacterium mulctrae]|uniref:EpsG family protein n=1 Tax=Chryseobacterium mulctrae TaxID=2576777 RepID=UPI001117A4BF|nr:EpsG family protein [Chryseobacterium mulctrae]
MIYLFVFFLSLIFFKLTDFFLDKKKGLAILFLIVAILIPSAFAGCRDLSIGTDTSFYVLEYFKEAKHAKNFFKYREDVARAETGYAIFNYIVVKIFNNISWLLFFIQGFIMLFITLAILQLKKSRLLPWAFLIYFLLYFSNSLNMTRQTMAIAMCIYAFSNLLTGRIIKALIIVCLAASFHFTAYIFLTVFPVYFYTSRFIKNFWLFQLVVSIACILFVVLLDAVIVAFIGVGVLGEGFGTYKSGGIYGSNLPVSDLFLCFVFFILFVFFKKYSVLQEFQKNLFQTIFLISIILCFAAVQSTFAIRGMYYFSFLSIIIVPLLITSIENKKIEYILWISVFCFFLLYWALTIPYANLGETYPYKSKILNL